MLQANRLQPFQGQLIAGSQAGKHVKCSNQALPIYNDLVSLAESGNYWALMIVRGIRGLTSGRLSMDNVYIDEDKSIASGPGVFYLVLPGVTATLEQLADGSYSLRGLKADMNYVQLQKSQQRPGLWRVGTVARGTDIEHPELVRSGDILKKENRAVVISDPSPKVANEALAARVDLVKVNSTTAGIVNNSGFDQHHTPGDGKLFGLKSVKDLIISSESRDITESSILLANTMYKARNINGVLWFAHWGGSAVLTRALQILKAEKAVSLDKHFIYLSRPTSNSALALELASELNMTHAEGGKDSGYTIREFRGNHFSSRLNKVEVSETLSFGLATTGATTGIAGLFGLGIHPVAGAAVTTLGAMYFVKKTISKAGEKLSGKKYN